MNTGALNQDLHSVLLQTGLPIPAHLPNPKIDNLSSDSRLIAENTLFLGSPGQTVDGGSFWSKALSSGAVAAIIGPEAAKLNPPSQHDPVVVVPTPVNKWIGELAAAFWQQPSSQLHLIGVTGTNGKTTTTYLIEHLSSFNGRPSALFGTLVNRWPNHSSVSTHTTNFADALQAQLAQAVRAGSQLGVMEVSSHALAQHRIAGCHFSGAVFTNLTQDHLDYHKSMDEYFESKSRLFREPLFGANSKKALVNVDDEWGLRLSKSLGDKCWRCSLDPSSYKDRKAELTVSEIKLSPSGINGVIKTPIGQEKFFLPLIGNFNVMNFMQAVGALIQEDFSLSELLSAVEYFPGVPGRMERIQIVDKEINSSALPTVLVDYAHTPDGLKNALISSQPFVEGKLICVFGCGGDRDRSKRSQMGSIAFSLADKIVLTSDNPRTENPQKIIDDVVLGFPLMDSRIIVELDRAKAIKIAIEQASIGDLVLIAGKGHEDYQIIGTKKIHFDDREQAESALTRKLNL